MNYRLAVLLVVGVFVRPCICNAAEEWPQFRGPDGQGHARSAQLPVVWSESENVAWKTKIPGSGHSSPVISGDQIWLTTAISTPLSDEEKQARLAKIKNSRGLELVGHLSLRAICVSRSTGKIIQSVEVFGIDNPEPIHSLNSYASPSPVIEQGRVYCHFGTYGTGCVETAGGQVVWRQADLHADHQNGPGSSPILWDNLLIANFDGIDTQFVAAVDKRDGKIAWSVKRSGKMNDRPEFQKAYCTPQIVETASGPCLVSPGADWVYGYDPETGTELWRAAYGQLGFSTVPRPVIGHGLAYICTSYMKSRLVAVRYEGRGDVTESNIAWTSDSQVPQKPSVLLVGNELYMGNDAGIVTCLDALSGEQIWRERIGGNYAASPIHANGHIYFFSREGRCTVIRAGREFEKVAVNDLDSGFMASPAVAGNSLYLRGESHLYRIDP